MIICEPDSNITIFVEFWTIYPTYPLWSYIIRWIQVLLYSSPHLLLQNSCLAVLFVSKRRGNLLKRVQWKKIYEILKNCCCATKNEFNNTAWAQGFKKYLRASLFLHNLRVLVTFMIMSRRNVLLFFWHCFWKHNEILCFPVLKH